MRSRILIIGVLVALLESCGGGGGSASVENTSLASSGAAPAPASPSPSPATATAGMSQNIAIWGDSLTPAIAVNLQVLYPDRTVVGEAFLGQTSTTIVNAEEADNDHRNWINVFWVGQNNETDPETIKADLARAIAHLAPGNRRFVVLAVINKSDPAESKGTPTYTTIVNLDNQLAALYPDNYIDIRSWLVAHYDASNPADVADHAADTIAHSMLYDDIHLRNEGSVLVAQRVQQFIDAHGW